MSKILLLDLTHKETAQKVVELGLQSVVTTTVESAELGNIGSPLKLHLQSGCPTAPCCTDLIVTIVTEG